jgi:hypothetical protein
MFAADVARKGEMNPPNARLVAFGVARAWMGALDCVAGE